MSASRRVHFCNNARKSIRIGLSRGRRPSRLRGRTGTIKWLYPRPFLSQLRLNNPIGPFIADFVTEDIGGSAFHLKGRPGARKRSVRYVSGREGIVAATRGGIATSFGAMARCRGGLPGSDCLRPKAAVSGSRRASAVTRRGQPATSGGSRGGRTGHVARADAVPFGILLRDWSVSTL